MNSYLEKLGLGWKAVLPYHNSDGNTIIMQGGPLNEATGIFPFVDYNRFTYMDESLELGVKNSLEIYLRDEKVTKAALKDMGVFLPDFVVPTFLNVKRNKATLESVPHELYVDGDLAITLRITYHPTDTLLEDLKINLNVTDDILKEFGMDFDTLYQYSLMNPVNQKNITMKPFSNDPETREIYIMSTEAHYLGASAMLYESKIHEMSDKLGGDMILIPNSINHCLALSNKNKAGKSWVQETLYNAKQDGYQKREMDLSDYLYAYNRETDEIRKTSQRVRQKPKMNKNVSR